MLRCSACGEGHPAGTVTCPRLNVSVQGGPCGTRIERYEIERYLGGGGFGAVYAARHTMLGQPVAVKLLRSQHAQNADVVARFLREARSAASILNAHVVRVTDFGVTQQGWAFLVMELLEGRDLEQLLRERGPVPPTRAVEIAVEILDGLAAAHAAGVIHRDMKPGNVILVRDSMGKSVAKIVDFGISKTQLDLEDNVTRSGTMMGTPHYIPPEQFRGARDVDARADVYAAGVILYEMLSGVRPYEADTYENLIVQVCTQAPRPLGIVAPYVPPALVSVIERAMAPDPDARWPGARAMADALRRLLVSGALSNAVGPPPVPPGTPPPITPVVTPEALGPTLLQPKASMPLIATRPTAEAVPAPGPAPRVNQWAQAPSQIQAPPPAPAAAGPTVPSSTPTFSEPPPQLPTRRAGLVVGAVIGAFLIIGAGAAIAWTVVTKLIAPETPPTEIGPPPLPQVPPPAPPSPDPAPAPPPSLGIAPEARGLEDIGALLQAAQEEAARSGVPPGEMPAMEGSESVAVEGVRLEDVMIMGMGGPVPDLQERLPAMARRLGRCRNQGEQRLRVMVTGVGRQPLINVTGEGNQVCGYEQLTAQGGVGRMPVGTTVTFVAVLSPR